MDLRPRPDFVKAYMHNVYLKSLEEVVHFYNTRDSRGEDHLLAGPRSNRKPGHDRRQARLEPQGGTADCHLLEHLGTVRWTLTDNFTQPAP